MDKNYSVEFATTNNKNGVKLMSKIINLILVLDMKTINKQY